jgi:purine-binding chemotaxis protein CheW
MDLMGRFGKTPRPVDKRTCIVIVEVASTAAHHVIGIVVDAVYEVLDLAASDIEPPPAIGNPMRREFIEGIGKVNGKFVILLDLGAVFSLEEWEAVAPAA